MHRQFFALRRARRAMRPLLLGVSALLGLSALLLAGCGESVPSASAVLQAGQQRFSNDSAFHFVLDTQNPGAAPSSTAFYPTKAEGDVQPPDKFQANVTVAIGALNITTGVVAIGNEAWVHDPTVNQWVPDSTIGGFANIFNPRGGIASLFTQISKPSKPADRSIAGTHCWSINGTLPAAAVSGLLGSSATATSPLGISVCIGKDDHQPYLVSLTGALIPGDKAQTEHDFTLSKFNEAVVIVSPAAN